MSETYRQELDARHEAKAKEICAGSPEFVKEYFTYLNTTSKQMSTKLSYLREAVYFLEFFKRNAGKELRESDFIDFPEKVLKNINTKDITDYKAYLVEKDKNGNRKVSDTSARKQLICLKKFFQFLQAEMYIDTNPMLAVDCPSVDKKDHIQRLDGPLSSQLLNGILKNDKFFVQKLGAVMPIPHKVWIKRERTVLRNYAITYLFLSTGIRVSELVALDISDIKNDCHNISIIAKGNKKRELSVTDDVADALRNYIQGVQTPPELSALYSPVSDMAAWAKKHIKDTELEKSLLTDFPDMTPEEISSVTLLTSHYRRQGREAFLSDAENESFMEEKNREQALFLSEKHTRLSVRMVEKMLKEYAMTYIPEYKDVEHFSPHNLRRTCATRILEQTDGNLSYAAARLGHENISVTNAFYAKLSKEKGDEITAKLSVLDW